MSRAAASAGVWALLACSGAAEQPRSSPAYTTAHLRLIAASAGGAVAAPESPRLCGGLYVGVPAATGSRHPTGLLRRDVVDPVMRDLAGGRSPDRLGAAAAAHVLLGRPRVAAALLDEALAAAPAVACLWSDLAAAYLVGAHSEAAGPDLVLALAAADRAVRLDRGLGEARINLALSLEALGLLGEARRAWCGASQLAPPGAVRDGLDGRCRAAAEAAQPARAGRWRGELQAAAAAGATPQLVEIARVAPRESREWVMEEALPQWGSAYQNGREAEAERILSATRTVGAVLAATTIDRTAADAVYAIDRAAPSSLRLMALGCQDYGAGRHLYTDFELDRAAVRLRRAAAALGPLRSPLALWSRLWLAGVVLQRGEQEAAKAALRLLLTAPGMDRYAALEGFAEWQLGVAYARTGSFAESLRTYREAASHLSGTREQLSIAGIASLTSEVLDYLGQERESWILRGRALTLLRAYPASVQRQNLLRDSARVVEAEGAPESALHFWTESLQAARGVGQPVLIVHTLLQRSRVAFRLGHGRAALGDLHTAQREISRIADAAMRDRLHADLAVTSAELDALEPAVQRHDRLAALSWAIRLFGTRKLDLEIVPALLVRAHLAIKLGDQRQAEADLRKGIETFEAQRGRLSDPEQRFSILATATQIYNEMIAFQASTRRDVEAAFEYAERARTSLGGPPLPAAELARQVSASLATAVSRALARRPREVVVLEYAVLDRDILVWRLDAHGFRCITLEGAVETVERLVRGFLEGLRGGAAAPRLQPIAAALFDELIAPVEVAGGALPPAAELMVIPDRFLNGLPFGALWDSRRRQFLLEQRAVALCPQASLLVLAHVRRGSEPAPDAPALLVGDPASDRALFPWLPPLHQAVQEVVRIAALYSRPIVLMGKAATRQRFLAALRGASLLHFAGHALPSADDPAATQLVLAASSVPGDLSTVSGRELLAEALPRLRLVVLSACGSATPDATRAGGLFGLARPFLTAGADAVVGTLWSTDDDAAGAVMPAFHQFVLEGDSAAQALRRAILPLTRAPTGAPLSPSRWAVFSVIEKG